VGADWMTAATTLPHQSGALRGVIGFTQKLPSTQRYIDWQARMPQLYPNETIYKWTTIPLSYLDTGWYDGILYFAQAIANVLYNNQTMSGPNLLKAMHDLNGKFTGVLGLMEVTLFCSLHPPLYIHPTHLGQLLSIIV
jgi:hypothetical protein